MLGFILLWIVLTMLFTGWFTYDTVVNFWHIFLEVPWYIKLLGLFVFAGSMWGGIDND